MDPSRAKMHCLVISYLYRYGWREPAGRRGWSTWCTDAKIVRDAIKQIRKDEPTLEIWLETKQRFG